MRFEGYDEEPLPEEDDVIEEVLGENPRARDLRLMRVALEQRYNSIREEQRRSLEERERTQITARLRELQIQIAALRREEAITTFVEDSVRVTLHKPSLEDEDLD